MKELDFNSAIRPTLELTMMDEARTHISVKIPSEKQIRRLASTMAQLRDIVTAQDLGGITTVYDMAAELISGNRQLLTVTGEDLAEKYHMELEDIVLFFSAYSDFIADIKNAKN